ncbi:MAG TPA: glycosyltransferase family 4 protein [Solirubrobacteraceae bacterium]|jgi:glycosyltransferase involved in cell wall biosynthesis
MIRTHMLIDDLSIGGAEVLLAELATVAPAAGIDMTVGYLSSRSGTQTVDRLRELGVEPEEVGVSRLSPGALAGVRRQLARFRPDLVHTHLLASDLLGVPAARSLRLPVVSTLHTMVWQGQGSDAVKEKLGIRLRRHLATRVVAVSDFARERYLAEGHDRPAHVTVVRNGVTGERAGAEAGARVRRELGLAPEDLVLSLIATLRPEKAHDVAIATVVRLRERGLPARLIVVGDGPSRHDVRAAADAAGDGAVIRTGFRDDVMAVLAATDVLLHAPRYDALPTTVIEAGAAGVPCVATRVGGIPEIVEDGVTGTLVGAPPEAEALAAALQPLLTDAELRARMGSAARERFEREFSAPGWAARLRALYEEVVA